MTKPPRVLVYGAGRAGLAVARRARERGTLAGVWNRRPLTGARAALAEGLPLSISADPEPVPADLWLVAVPDDAIGFLAERLAAALEGRAEGPRAAAHCSGTRAARELAALHTLGVPCGSWHPAMTFRGVESDAAALADAWVAVEGDPTALEVLRFFSAALGLACHHVAADHKPGYHSALVIAANGRVALDAAAERLLTDAGLDTGTARRVLAPLVARIEENLRAAGPLGALTGPVGRGDAATIRTQLAALNRRPPIRQLYRALAANLLPLVPGAQRDPGHRAVAELVEAKDGTDAC